MDEQVAISIYTITDMSVPFSKGIFQAFLSQLHTYQKVLSELSYSHSQIFFSVCHYIFQLPTQTSSSHHDHNLVLPSLKQTISKFSTINQALVQFYLNCRQQIALINQDQQSNEDTQQTTKTVPIQSVSSQQGKQRNREKGGLKQKAGNEAKGKKRARKQKRGIKEVQKQAQCAVPFTVSFQGQQTSRNVQQIQLLKQLLQTKILSDYFKAESLQTDTFLMLAT